MIYHVRIHFTLASTGDDAPYRKGFTIQAPSETEAVRDALIQFCDGLDAALREVTLTDMSAARLSSAPVPDTVGQWTPGEEDS